MSDENPITLLGAAMAEAEPTLPLEMPVAFRNPQLGEVITSNGTGSTYQIGHVIGQGNFSKVFACSDDWGNDLVAKVLKPDSDYQTIKRKAEQEFRILRQLRHPHITHVFDAFEYENAFYIITEKCTFSIDELFQQDWFVGSSWVLPIARCLLQAIEFVHLNGMVHKDVHPGNVLTMLTRNELGPKEMQSVSFRLGDLGIADLITEIAPHNTFAKWMLPPECEDSRSFGEVGKAVDIYHCGLLFLQLCYNKPLHFSKEERLAGEPRRLALQLDSPYRNALEKSLRRRVSYRTSSPRELWRDLNTPADL